MNRFVDSGFRPLESPEQELERKQRIDRMIKQATAVRDVEDRDALARSEEQ